MRETERRGSGHRRKRYRKREGERGYREGERGYREGERGYREGERGYREGEGYREGGYRGGGENRKAQYKEYSREYREPRRECSFEDDCKRLKVKSSRHVESRSFEEWLEERHVERERGIVLGKARCWGKSPSPPATYYPQCKVAGPSHSQHPGEKKSEKMEENEGSKSNLGDSDDDCGPLIPTHAAALGSFGKGLKSGEGAAMAVFVEEKKRIPRRGEIGMSAEEISKFEALGYVMSGSRHKIMNMVRERKEAQVYSADEKRAQAQKMYELRAAKETKVLATFRNLVQEKQKAIGALKELERASQDDDE